ncbi:MAG: hypothetical protein ACOCSQ_00140 [Planctomycetota bacterium]
MADEKLTEEQVLDKLGLSEEELQELIQTDQLSVEMEDGQRLYTAEEVDALAGAGDIDLGDFDLDDDEDIFDFTDELDGELAEDEAESGESGEVELEAEEEGFEEDESLDALEEEGSTGIGSDVVDLETWGDQQGDVEEEDSDIFDFEEESAEEGQGLDRESGTGMIGGEDEDMDVGTDVVDIAAWDRSQEEETAEKPEETEGAEAAVEGEEGQEPIIEMEEADEEVEEEESPGLGSEFALEEDEEMETEVVDVSSVQEDEDELLGDIIEDAGEVPEEELIGETTDGLAGEETVDMATSAEPTEEVTEWGDQTAEETAEITELGEEEFEAEELEDMLAAEEEDGFGGEAGEEYEWTAEAAMASEAEAPVSTWVVVLLVLIFAVQMVAGLYVVENALNPDYSTGITQSLSFFQSE